MKTSAARNTRTFEMTCNRHLDEFDELVKEACRGDERAIGAIATALGPTLLEEARNALGDLYLDADCVVNELLDTMLAGRFRFRPARGRAIHWMCGIIWTIAQRRRREHLSDWDWRTDTQHEDQ